jgi:pimeloyl-ACP methyl ester carboxylesterase
LKKKAVYKNETVSFLDEGKGRTVVLLHGFLGAAEIWRPIIDDLSKRYRVIAIDLPGHGGTACMGYVHSMELMAKCIKAVLDSLKLRKYVIIGHSMGGYAALAFADLYPDNLKGLCLFHSTSYSDSPEKKTDRLRAIEVVKAGKNPFIRSTISNLFAEKNLKYLKNEVAFATKIANQTSKQGMVAALHGMRDRTQRDLILGMVNYPVMMVIGRFDKVLMAEQLLEQSHLIINKTVLILEQDGHFGFLESPRESNMALRKFLRKCYGNS